MNNDKLVCKPPKILLITAAYGVGHDMSMQGIKDALADRGVPYEVMNAVEDGDRIDKVSSWFWGVMMRHAHFLWALFYPYPITSGRPIRIGYRVLYRDKYAKTLARINPDIIIANHYIGALAGCLYKEDKPELKIYTIITDYVAHPLWTWQGVDAYFVGLEQTKQQVLKYDVPPEIVHVTGIPIRKQFWQVTDKIVARNKLTIPLSAYVVLLAAGSANSVELKPVLKQIKQHNLFVIILSGKEDKAEEKYQKILKDLGMTGLVFPFIQDVASVLAATDVFVSKAGGITSAECLAYGVPCIFMRNMPGQEHGNAKLLARLGVAINAKRAEAASHSVTVLSNDASKRHKMAEKALTLGKPQAAVTIIEKILKYSI